MADRPISCVAVIGTGVIGASWAALVLARGLDVVATDPSPGAEARLRGAIEAAWPTLSRLGLEPGASPGRCRFAATLEEALDGADFVQENGPEKIDVKRETYALMDAIAGPDILLATSSSGLKPSDIQVACARHPERVLVGHPFNPPHLVPLVEVVGGSATSEVAIDRAMSFYRTLGKHPIRIRRELVGHVANRLQAALWREAFHLVETGAVTVAEVDAAIAHGPGLRWALMGPCLLQHLSGGAAGIGHTLDHLGPLMETMWADLGSVTLTPELKRDLVEGVDLALAGIDPGGMMAERDRLLVDLLAAKAGTRNLP